MNVREKYHDVNYIHFLILRQQKLMEIVRIFHKNMSLLTVKYAPCVI